MRDGQQPSGGEEHDLDVDTGTEDGADTEDQFFDTLDDALAATSFDEEDPQDGQSDQDTGESDDQDADQPDETADGNDPAGGNAPLVTLDTGEQLPLDEVAKGYLRGKDYTQKTEAVARERKSIEEVREQYAQRAQSLQTTFQNLETFLTGLVPPEPDANLAATNPAAYTQQKALRDQAIGEIRQLVDMRQGAEQQVQQASADDIARYKAAEETKLLETMPGLKEPAKKAAFDAANKKTALEFGFSEAEIDKTADHRILRLVHYARIGQIAEQNRRNAKRRTAQKPTKGQKTTATNRQAKPSRNREAMKRLSKSGSLEDAMRINID